MNILKFIKGFGSTAKKKVEIYSFRVLRYLGSQASDYES